MTNVPAAWRLSPARELTPNTQVITTLCSGWACLLLYATMQSCWLTFKLLQQPQPEIFPLSACLQTEACSHVLDRGRRRNWVKRKTGRYLLLCGKTSAEALSCAGGAGGADACCSSGLSREIHAQERRRL